MKYAVVTSGGKQYKVHEGDTLTVDQLPVEQDSVYTFPEVLLYVDGDEKHVGQPAVMDATVSGKVVDHTKGEKIRVARFKAKARYRKVTGFRARLTTIHIDSVTLKKGTTAKETTEKAVLSEKKSTKTSPKK